MLAKGEQIKGKHIYLHNRIRGEQAEANTDTHTERIKLFRCNSRAVIDVLRRVLLLFLRVICFHFFCQRQQKESNRELQLTFTWAFLIVSGESMLNLSIPLVRPPRLLLPPPRPPPPNWCSGEVAFWPRFCVLFCLVVRCPSFRELRPPPPPPPECTAGECR